MSCGSTVFVVCLCWSVYGVLIFVLWCQGAVCMFVVCDMMRCVTGVVGQGERRQQKAEALGSGGGVGSLEASRVSGG